MISDSNRKKFNGLERRVELYIEKLECDCERLEYRNQQLQSAIRNVESENKALTVKLSLALTGLKQRRKS